MRSQYTIHRKKSVEVISLMWDMKDSTKKRLSKAGVTNFSEISKLLTTHPTPLRVLTFGGNEDIYLGVLYYVPEYFLPIVSNFLLFRVLLQSDILLILIIILLPRTLLFT